MVAYAFIKCLASLLGGSITDKWGAVPVIAVCLFFIGIFGFLGTFGSNYDFLLLFRILVSIGVAFILSLGSMLFLNMSQLRTSARASVI